MPQQSHSNVLRKVFTEFFLGGDLANYEQYIAKDITIHCPPSGLSQKFLEQFRRQSAYNRRT